MRLTEKDKRTVWIKAQESAKDERGAVKPGYAQEGVVIKAVIQPVSSRLAAQTYGLKANSMLLLLYDGSAAIRAGDGVCVDVDAAQTPDYRVVSRKLWGGYGEYEIERL